MKYSMEKKNKKPGKDEKIREGEDKRRETRKEGGGITKQRQSTKKGTRFFIERPGKYKGAILIVISLFL